VTEQIKFIDFPALEHASPEGLLAMGGDLDQNTIISAYAQGIFPWFSEEQPVLWWSPNPRLVLYPKEFKLSRSLRKKIRNKGFQLTANQQFSDVIAACAMRGADTVEDAPEDTWITSGMKQAYIGLHNNSYAHSIEVSLDGRLVGGLYGIALGSVFFGESMFSRTSDASKVALFALCQWLQERQFKMIDCQVSSNHLLSLGARKIDRSSFISALEKIDIQQADNKFNLGFEQYWSENVIKSL